MLDSPSPTHGFLPVTLVFLTYVVSSLVVTAMLLELGVSTALRVPLFLAVAGVLLVPYLRLFRQFAPTTPGDG